MGFIQVKNIKIGEGIPKVIVPLMGSKEEELLEEIATIKMMNPDMIEWRADVFERVDNLESVKSIISQISYQLKDIPLLFTFRSHKEGGDKKITATAYFELLTTAIQSGKIDLVDIELFSAEDKVTALVKEAKENDVCVILSNHDFSQTPSKDEITSRLGKMLELGADIPKLAVMPNNAADVLTLLDATNEIRTKHEDTPIITMAMGQIGLISRLVGEVFGSAATFAAGKQASAPGQIAVSDLRSVLNILHNEK